MDSTVPTMELSSLFDITTVAVPVSALDNFIMREILPRSSDADSV